MQTRVLANLDNLPPQLQPVLPLFVDYGDSHDHFGALLVVPIYALNNTLDLNG